MPICINNSYTENPFWLFNGQLQTIIPGAFRKVDGVQYSRERLELSDDDFVDLDWVRNGNKKLVVLLHGLEGNSSRQYMLSPAKYFSEKGWDVVAFNCRSCSGEMNRKLRLYHHGEIEDLRQVIEHIVVPKVYDEIVLSGYSMGGAILSKYLSVYAGQIPAEIKCGISFSAPFDLEESMKAKQFPGRLDVRKIDDFPKWREFDAAFSAPMNGFQSVDDFYYDAACKNFLHDLDTPLLIVMAKNDPIISTTCVPLELCKRHPKIKFELTKHGGHVGYSMFGKPYNWMDVRALEFAEKLV